MQRAAVINAVGVPLAQCRAVSSHSASVPVGMLVGSSRCLESPQPGSMAWWWLVESDQTLEGRRENPRKHAPFRSFLLLSWYHDAVWRCFFREPEGHKRARAVCIWRLWTQINGRIKQRVSSRGEQWPALKRERVFAKNASPYNDEL